MMPSFLRTTAAGLLVVATTACSDSSQNKPATAPGSTAAPDTATVRQVKAQYKISIGAPVIVDSSDFYYQPVGVNVVESSSRKRLESYSSYSAGDETFNLVFTRHRDYTTHLLLPHGRFLITEVNSAAQPVARYPFLFCTVVEQDFDRNGSLTEADAKVLYVADRDGRNARRLTEATAQLQQYLVLAGTSTLLVELRYDTNRNQKFGEGDLSTWLRYDLRNMSAPPQPHPAVGVQQELTRQLVEFKSQQAAAQ